MLSRKTKDSLEVAVASTAVADEIEEKLFAPAELSDEAKAALEIGMCDPQASDEVADAIAAGASSISSRAGRALEIALASRAAAKEMFEY